jgi:hypothetical protein
VKESSVVRHHAVNLSLILGLTFAASVTVVPEARAEGISGSWSGGGTVSFASGQRERARCRAHYSGGGSVVSMSGTCATPSGNVSQSAQLRRVGPNSYAGSFFNPEYNASGSIRVTVRGNTQSVTISGGAGSASLTLRH